MLRVVPPKFLKRHTVAGFNVNGCGECLPARFCGQAKTPIVELVNFPELLIRTGRGQDQTCGHAG